MKKMSKRNFLSLLAVCLIPVVILAYIGYHSLSENGKKFTAWKKHNAAQRSVSQYAEKLHGACFAANSSAFLVSDLLSKSMGERNFNSIGSLTLLNQQLKKWKFKRHPAADLHKAKRGAILIFKRHSGIYLGKDMFIDAVPGWYAQCGIRSNQEKYSELIGKSHKCTKKNPYTALNSNTPELEKLFPQRTKLNSKVQCVAKHRLKSGKVYKNHPLIAFYQAD